MSNPFNHGEFPLNVSLPDNGDADWQGGGAVNERQSDVEIGRLFPGYDLFPHDRNQDFNLPGLRNVPTGSYTDEEY